MISDKKFILRESLAPHRWIGQDGPSGGYPYPVTDWLRARIWETKEEALAYAAMFKDEQWELHTVRGCFEFQQSC